MVIQSPPKAFGYQDSVHGTIGQNNKFLSFNILRLSGEQSFILYAGANAVEELIFDNLKVQTFHPRPTSSPENYFLHFSNSDIWFEKALTFRNTAFPAFPAFPVDFGGSVIQGSWKVKFEGVTVAGVPLLHDRQIRLHTKGDQVTTSYS